MTFRLWETFTYFFFFLPFTQLRIFLLSREANIESQVVSLSKRNKEIHQKQNAVLKVSLAKSDNFGKIFHLLSSPELAQDELLGNRRRTSYVWMSVRQLFSLCTVLIQSS